MRELGWSLLNSKACLWTETAGDGGGVGHGGRGGRGGGRGGKALADMVSYL